MCIIADGNLRIRRKCFECNKVAICRIKNRNVEIKSHASLLNSFHLFEANSNCLRCDWYAKMNKLLEKEKKFVIMFPPSKPIVFNKHMHYIVKRI